MPKTEGEEEYKAYDNTIQKHVQTFMAKAQTHNLEYFDYGT
jgi:hypothetical protein